MTMKKSAGKKLGKKKRLAFPFNIAKTFPPSDPLAVDLLRVMAGANDIAMVTEWIYAHKQMPKNPEALSYAAGRWSLQFRLLAAIMFETLIVLDEMEKFRQPDFSSLKASLDEDGISALERLRKVMSGADPFSKKFLAIARNKVAYHYDRDLFRLSLERLLTPGRFGQNSTSKILFNQEGLPEEQFFFELADMVRVEISVGLTGAGGGNQELTSLLDLVKAFVTFLESFLVAYAKHRGFSIIFS
jgi:hypothetical protein